MRFVWTVLVLVVAVLAGAGGQRASAQPKAAAPLPSDLKAAGVLKVGTKCDYPPFGFVDASGKTVGFDVDLAQQLATIAFGNPNALQLQCVSSANRIPYLTTQRVDLIIATLGYNPDRARVVSFSKPYFAQTGRVLVVKASKITSLQQLAGQKVIVDKGTPYGGWFSKCMPTVGVVEYETVSEAVTALKEGRGQGYADDDTLLVGLAAKDPTLGVIGGLYSSLFGVGMRQGDDALTAWVNDALAQLQAKDYFWTDFKKWVPDKHLQEIFASAMPRPGHDIAYPTGPIVHC